MDACLPPETFLRMAWSRTRTELPCGAQCRQAESLSDALPPPEQPYVSLSVPRSQGCSRGVRALSATRTWTALLVPMYSINVPRGKKILAGGVQTAGPNHGRSKGKTCSLVGVAGRWGTSAGRGRGVQSHLICLVSVNDNTYVFSFAGPKPPSSLILIFHISHSTPQQTCWRHLQHISRSDHFLPPPLFCLPLVPAYPV